MILPTSVQWLSRPHAFGSGKDSDGMCDSPCNAGESESERSCSPTARMIYRGVDVVGETVPE